MCGERLWVICEVQCDGVRGLRISTESEPLKGPIRPFYRPLCQSTLEAARVLFACV